MNWLETIVLGVLSSVIASLLFWLLTFRLSRTNIEFPSAIEKSPSLGREPGPYRYMIRILNTGLRDLYEVTFLVKLSVAIDGIIHYTYISLGSQNVIPILRGRRYQRRHPDGKFAHKLTLKFSPGTRAEFQKTVYADAIRAKAAMGILSLDDVFQQYPLATIRIHAFGYDEVTGSRRLFLSPPYTYAQVKSGAYSPSKPLSSFSSYRKYREHLLSIQDAPCAESSRQTDPHPEAKEPPDPSGRASS